MHLFVGRDVQDWTDRLCRLVLAVRTQVEADSVILESECVAFDPATRRVLPRKQFHRALHHRLIVYDLLAFEDEDWRSRPYAERHALTTHMIRSDLDPGLVGDSQDKLATSLAELEALFADCRANEEEGLIVVKPSSLYKSGLRSRDRVKVKAVDPVDAVIVGYYLDEKAAIPTPKTFLLAVYDEQRNLFVTIGKAISGLTDQSRFDLYQRCKGLEAAFNPRVEARFAPDRWVRPELVVEVEVDYVFQSKDYTCGSAYKGTGYAGQHIRFVSGQIREDKSPEQATTVDEFLQMRGEPGVAEDGSPENNSDTLQLSLF